MDSFEIKIYRNPNGISPIEVKIENDTVWLNQYQLEEVFETNRSTINKHILNIYRSGELDEKATCAKNAQVRKEGNKRIAAFIFLYFLEKNKILFSKDGSKRIADNALVALTLMIAVSKPEEKNTMVKVIVNLINSKNI